MVYKIKILNLSSGDMIIANAPNLTKFNITRNQNWEPTTVIGRMDPIYNFKNTETKLEFGMNTSEVNHLKYPRDIPLNQMDIDDFFKLDIPKKGKLMFKEKEVQISNLNVNKYTSLMNSFLYPSYETKDDTIYYVKTAPIYLVKITDNSQNSKFQGYCTMPSFNHVSNKYVNAFGQQYLIGLDLNFNIIHTNINFISSRIFKNPLTPQIP